METRKNHVESNFYNAAYLLSQDYVIDKIEKAKFKRGRTVYHFTADSDMVKKDLEKFKDDEALGCYVKNGVMALRKILKVTRAKQRNAEKSTAVNG